MATSQRRAKKKESGARYKKDRSKRKSELARPAALTKIGEKTIRPLRVKGGNYKYRAIQSQDVIITAGKKAIKTKITGISKNAANRHFVRMGVITKGAIIETEKGKVRITNRPGQSGQIQGVIVKE